MLNNTKGLTINQRKYHGNLKGGYPPHMAPLPPQEITASASGDYEGIMGG